VFPIGVGHKEYLVAVVCHAVAETNKRQRDLERIERESGRGWKSIGRAEKEFHLARARRTGDPNNLTSPDIQRKRTDGRLTVVVIKDCITKPECAASRVGGTGIRGPSITHKSSPTGERGRAAAVRGTSSNNIYLWYPSPGLRPPSPDGRGIFHSHHGHVSQLSIVGN
jgi:hypothetical protein